MLLPRFSGDQYNAGRHIPPSQAKRGDLIFYGPGGGQHVTIYLGNGQMLEASGSAGKVTVSPVRKARDDAVFNPDHRVLIDGAVCIVARADRHVDGTRAAWNS